MARAQYNYGNSSSAVVLEPMISTGVLRFSRRQRTLLDQLRQFPMAAHDDGPDALQMAVELAHKPGNRWWVETYG